MKIPARPRILLAGSNKDPGRRHSSFIPLLDDPCSGLLAGSIFGRPRSKARKRPQKEHAPTKETNHNPVTQPLEYTNNDMAN